MSISLKRYVDITSGVGAGSDVSTRSLIGRFFTDNTLVPTGSFVEFTSAEEVGNYFGTTSQEFLRAQFYFGWISKDITRAKKISFARWADTAVAPQIFGAPGPQSIGAWNPITAGAFVLTMGGITHNISGLNFSSDANLAAVASRIQSAINAESFPAQFTGAIAISHPASFTGVIATSGGIDTLTVSGITGTIAIGQTVQGAGVSGGTTITAFGTGTGGNGTYQLSSSGQTVASEAMTSGAAFNTLTVSAINGTIQIGQVVAGSGVTGSPTITAFGTGTGGNGTYILSTNSLTVASEAMTAGTALALWSAATVSYDAVRGSFDLTGGATGPANVSVAAGPSGNDIALQLGWLSPQAIFSSGSLVQSITDLLTQSANASNNFGSFAFVQTLTQAQIVQAATWNNGENVMFIYSVPCTAVNAAALSIALANIGGVSLTLSPLANEYPEQVPMMIMAATDYTKPNSVQNYEFQIFDLTPSVATDSDADLYDGLSINYYGQTQTAGQLIQFYQQGVMQGLPVDPLDQNTYANEVWLKDAAGAVIMTLLLALAQVPANNKGRSQLLAVLQSVIDQALFNGTISVGKPLTTVQQLYISEITNDPKAWYQVQNLGYWRDVVIVAFSDDGVTKYKAVYTLVYSKDDIIRLVEGSDVLI